MIELSVHFTSDEKDETSDISVKLFRPDTGNWTSDVPFEQPLDDAALADLWWYLEVFAGWPTGPDYERAVHLCREALDDYNEKCREPGADCLDRYEYWIEQGRDPGLWFEKEVDDETIAAGHPPRPAIPPSHWRLKQGHAIALTPEQIVAYQQRMRQSFLEQIGGLPERTPLNARVVGREPEQP